MEYDDSDFQGQNLHLAGDESSKFSSVLCPYALPKFDFDDSFQGHLRFDSLVENEVFLGIPSQEDNQWIEDFSRGNSGIEFKSSAAESCTISRHNNVWSEATSSESVEMLLKSVGQEEMVPGETIVEESHVANELGSLTKQTDPDSKQDDQVEDVKDSHHVLRQDELQGNFSRLNEGDEGDHSHLEHTLRSPETKLCAYGSSMELDPNAVSEMCSLCATEENLGMDKCNNLNQKGVDTSIDESQSIKMQEDASISAIPVDNIDSSLQNDFDSIDPSSHNVIASVSKLNDEEIAKNASGLPKDICGEMDEQGVQIMEIGMVDHILHKSAAKTCDSNLVTSCGVSSNIESLEECAHESSIIKSENPSSLPLEGDGELQIAEGHSEDVCSMNPSQGGKSEVMVFPKITEIKQQVKSDVLYKESPVASEGDCGFEGHASNVSSSQEGSCINVEMKMDSLVSIRCGPSGLFDEKFLRSDIQTDLEVSVGNSEPFNLSVKDNKTSEQCDKSNINDAGDLASLTGSSLSPEFHREQLSTNILSCDSDASDVLTKMQEGSTQLCKLDTSSDQCVVHICDQGVPFYEGRVPELLVDSSNMEVEIVGSVDSEKRDESPFIGGDIKENADATHGSEFDIIAGNELENVKLASHGTLDGAPSLSGTGATADESANRNEERDLLLLVEGSHLDEKEDMEAEANVDANLLAHKDSSQVSTVQTPISEVEKDATCDCAVEIPRQIVSQSLPVVESLNAGDKTNLSEQIVVNEANEECSEKSEAFPIHSDSTVKEGDCAKAVFGNHEETTIRKNCEVAPLKASVDSAMDCQASSDLAQSSDANPQIETGSAITSGCTELSQSQKGKKVGGHIVENVPLPKVPDCADGKVQSYLRENDASKEERSFTFDVSPSASLSEGQTSKDWQSFPTIQACNMSTNIKRSASASHDGKLDPKVVRKFSQGSPQAFDGGTTDGASKATPKRKTRRTSAKSGEENGKKGSYAKETTLTRLPERGDKSHLPTSHTGPGQFMQSEELKPCGHVEHSATKPTGGISIPMTNLLDLNNSAAPSALFKQPFTDMQQVQLRAQIFVYGSLIQGAVPDEACMISAFGPSDGERRVWEPSWHACVERLHGQRTHATHSESPVQSSSGAKVSDQPVRQGSVQSKVCSSPIRGASSKGASSPVVNPMIPLSSPLWNISTPSDNLQSGGMLKGTFVDYHHVLSPLHPYQTSPVQNYVGCTTSWISQAPIPSPWFASPQTYGFESARFSAFPITEAVKLTPVKESSVPIYSSAKHISSVPVAHSGVSSGYVGNSSLLEINKLTVKPGQHSADAKARKRKKVPVSENLGQISLPTQTQAVPLSASAVSSTLSKKITVSDGIGQITLHAPNQFGLMSAPVVSSHFSTSVAVMNTASATPTCVSTGNSGKLLTAVSPINTSDHYQRVDQTVEKRTSILDETFSKVEEAKLQADDAASHATAAFGHCQGLWSQLHKQKDSRLISDVDAKLASAAVAIAAAASVAKAAAAAANVASNAAAQAKLMVDEALPLCGTGNFTLSNANPLSNFINELVKATPASILKGGDGSNFPSSIREVARRRVETTSVASRQAENLDAAVKAAELAAEAVSQVGKIVAMGDPLPLSVLVETGPEGYWKALQVPYEQGVRSNNVIADQSNLNIIRGVPSISAKSKEGPSDKEPQTTTCGLSPLLREGSKDMSEDGMRVVDCISGSAAYCERNASGQRGLRASNLARTIGVVPESQIGSRSNSVINQDRHENGQEEMRANNSIREGCHVEVFKEGGDFKGAWFSANVLSLKDGKAFVAYTELQSDEGRGQLKEWIPLEGKGTKAPILRIAHPMTNMHFEGTRKRRRVAMGDYAWSIGDRVDVWMQDCWREGVVTEKNKKDETMLTIHFPAQGESSVVRAWHLRPTLVWKDGVWIELLRSREECSSQGDTPQEKRLKVGSPPRGGKEKDKMPKNRVPVESGKHEESRLLPLSVNERVFNVGKSTTDEKKPEAPRIRRTGLQKDGSRVIFGIPKPGKKRKFMEVSKHYVSDRSSKNNAAKDSLKFMKYSVPQGPGFHGWKDNFRIDSKEKQAPESKSKVLKSGKGQSASARSFPLKDNLLASVSTPNDTAIEDKPRNRFSNDENDSHQNLMGFGSFSKNEAATDGSVLFSKQSLPLNAPKKESTSNAKAERLNRGKLAAGGGKSSKGQVKDKSIPDVVEPRRSNRRIQPTSRLLEGLQSSLIIPKIPAASHDKNHKSQNRSTTKGLIV